MDAHEAMWLTPLANISPINATQAERTDDFLGLTTTASN
jgi:hypothetical protein